MRLGKDGMEFGVKERTRVGTVVLDFIRSTRAYALYREDKWSEERMFGVVYVRQYPLLQALQKLPMKIVLTVDAIIERDVEGESDGKDGEDGDVEV